MISHRNETLTGVFVLVTFLVAAGAVMALIAPGVLHKQNTYYVFFDNAGGIEPGIDVLLGGRHVGQVVSLQSPVPLAERPEDHKELEALVKIRVMENERIYNVVTVRMIPIGMLGLQVIDFVNGDETTGVATSGTKFVGMRVPGLNDATEQMTSRLAELKTSIENINQLTAEGGDLSASAANARGFTAKIRDKPWRLVWPDKKKHHKHGADTREAKAEKEPSVAPK